MMEFSTVDRSPLIISNTGNLPPSPPRPVVLPIPLTSKPMEHQRQPLSDITVQGLNIQAPRIKNQRPRKWKFTNGDLLTTSDNTHIGRNHYAIFCIMQTTGQRNLALATSVLEKCEIDITTTKVRIISVWRRMQNRIVSWSDDDHRCLKKLFDENVPQPSLEFLVENLPLETSKVSQPQTGRIAVPKTSLPRLSVLSEPTGQPSISLLCTETLSDSDDELAVDYNDIIGLHAPEEPSGNEDLDRLLAENHNDATYDTETNPLLQIIFD